MVSRKTLVVFIYVLLIILLFVEAFFYFFVKKKSEVADDYISTQQKIEDIGLSINDEDLEKGNIYSKANKYLFIGKVLNVINDTIVVLVVDKNFECIVSEKTEVFKLMKKNMTREYTDIDSIKENLNILIISDDKDCKNTNSVSIIYE